MSTKPLWQNSPAKKRHKQKVVEPVVGYGDGGTSEEIKRAIGGGGGGGAGGNFIIYQTHALVSEPSNTIQIKSTT